MPVTIKDIAKAAGVSHTTVSRALRGNPAISNTTTARIERLAQDMGYVPSAVAQSLHAQQTLTIGMVVTTIADPFIVKVVEGVESVAQAAGYSVFLSTSNNDPDRELAVVETFRRRRVDAIIVTSSRVGRLHSSQLNQVQVPIVLINNQGEGKYLYSVAIDDEQGAGLAVTHLLGLRHRRIAYIGVPDRPKSNQRRLAGFLAALERAGIAPDPGLTCSPEAGDDFQRGQAAFEAIEAARASAVFAYNDVIAIGLMAACAQHGVAVPGRLSVVGFDDIEAAVYVNPGLTTVHQPRLKLGQLAMTMTLDLLNGRKTQDQKLACELRDRASTAKISDLPPSLIVNKP
jgi:LacI family transcriptional regulator/LacI family repressor for deo operon, udp, cdd, tsx, nupC, and nupG